MTKCQKDPTCGIFLKRGLFKDIKNYIPMCRTHKYKNTNTQIRIDDLPRPSADNDGDGDADDHPISLSQSL